MKVVLFAAISVDGYIARKNGDTDWVKDEAALEKAAQDFGCVVMGNATFREYGQPPFEGVQHLILTSKDAGMDVKSQKVSYATSPKQAVNKVKELGSSNLLIIGGARCNGSFAEAGLINEIWLDIHPIVLGEGIKLLGDYNGSLELVHISSEDHEQGFSQSKYKIKTGKNWGEL